MKTKIITAVFLVISMCAAAAYAGHHEKKEGQKPALIEASMITLEATVEAVDYKNRTCTLKGPQGNVVTIDVGPEVKNFEQVEVGDVLTVDYLETVAIQVLSAEEAEPGATASAALASAKKGEKPAGLAVEEATVIVTIEAIDMENNLVTLKNAAGESKTVQPRNPENLKKVKIGDRVMITFAEALAINVTEKPAEK